MALNRQEALLFKQGLAGAGLAPPVKEGVLTEAMQGAQLTAANVVRMMASTGAEFGVPLASGVERAAEEYIADRPELGPSPDYKILSLDPANLARTAAGGLTSAAPTVGAGVVGTLAGGPAVGTVAAVSTAFAMIYGDERKEMERVLPKDIPEITKDYLAFMSTLGQSVTDALFGPEAIARKLVTKSFLDAAKKQLGKSGMRQFAAAIAGGGASEGFDELFELGISTAVKRAGGATAEDVPIPSFKAAMETFVSGAIPGAILGGGMNVVQQRMTPEVEPDAEPEPEVEQPSPDVPVSDQQTTTPATPRLAEEEQVRRETIFNKRWERTEETDEDANALPQVTQPVTVVKPKTKADRAAVATAKALGLEVVFIESPELAGRKHGFKKGNKAFVVADITTDPSLVVVYAEFRAKVLENAESGKLGDFQKRLEQNGYEPGQEIDDETIASVMGDMFGDARMWEQVASMDKGLFQRLLDTLVQFIDRLNVRLKGQAGAADMLTNLDNVRAAAANAIGDAKFTPELQQALQELSLQGARADLMTRLGRVEAAKVEEAEAQRVVREDEDARDVKVREGIARKQAWASSVVN